MLYNKFAHNFSELNYPLEDEQNFAIAVSGGVDSIALLLLMHQWALGKSKLQNIVILTVDHGLRHEASTETDYVEELSHRLGFKCVKFCANLHKSWSNLQAVARKARYDLMADYCNKSAITTILTAHHQDDYIENFLIRTQRKSGALGLSAGTVHYHNDIRIIRPLFNIFKQELMDYVRAKNVQWFEDQSNYSDIYQRNKIRIMLSGQSQQFKEDIIVKQAEINQEARHLSQLLVRAIAELVAINPLGFATLNLALLLTYDFVIQLKLLSFVLTMIAAKSSTPRAELVVRVLKSLQHGDIKACTLHGCAIKQCGQNLLIHRSFGKTPPETVKLEQGAFWDNRFFCDINGGKISDEGAFITYLTERDYSEIKKSLDLAELKKLTFNHHKAILFTIPAIKTLEKLVALPHISYYNDVNLWEKVSFSYEPKFTSRFTHFF